MSCTSALCEFTCCAVASSPRRSTIARDRSTIVWTSSTIQARTWTARVSYRVLAQHETSENSPQQVALWISYISNNARLNWYVPGVTFLRVSDCCCAFTRSNGRNTYLLILKRQCSQWTADKAERNDSVENLTRSLWIMCSASSQQYWAFTGVHKINSCILFQIRTRYDEPKYEMVRHEVNTNNSMKWRWYSAY